METTTEMKKNSIRKLIQKRFDVTHGGTIFNIAVKYAQKYGKDIEFEQGSAWNWKKIETVVNKDTAHFRKWLYNQEDKDHSFHLEKKNIEDYE